MAFFNRARSILQQTVTKHINHEIAASTPSIFQVIRCMSSSKLFVGGLSYTTDEPSLTEAFNKYGDVVEARVIVDRDTGRSRGFGFVTFTDIEAAASAIQALDGQDLHGRMIRVNYANDRVRGYGGGGGGYGGGGYGGGGYGGGGYGGGGSYGGGSSGGYGATGGDSYGSGGNYASGGGGGGSAGSYGGGTYSSGSTYATGYRSTGNNYDNGSVSHDGGSGQSFGVAGGADSYSTGGNFADSSLSTSGYTGNQELSYGGRNQFGNDEGINTTSVDGSFKQDDSLEGNFQDDNEPDDYVDRRA